MSPPTGFSMLGGRVSSPNVEGDRERLTSPGAAVRRVIGEIWAGGLVAKEIGATESRLIGETWAGGLVAIETGATESRVTGLG